jgi:DNA-binding transcriptional ArsR family regulator
MLLALSDGRALPASVLASDAGVKAATASAHLDKLRAAGLVTVEPHGRFRYYRLAGSDVAQLIEVAARLSPPQSVRSLREGTSAHALRLARRCYDHLAGRLAVSITDRLIDLGGLAGGDGSVVNDTRAGRLSGGIVDDTAYVVTKIGREQLAQLGVATPAEISVRCCRDWSEQRHHLAGLLGRNLLGAMTEAGWLHPSPHSRAVFVTEEGKAALGQTIGLSWPPPHGATRLSAA